MQRRNFVILSAVSLSYLSNLKLFAFTTNKKKTNSLLALPPQLTMLSDGSTYLWFLSNEEAKLLHISISLGPQPQEMVELEKRNLDKPPLSGKMPLRKSENYSYVGAGQEIRNASLFQ